MFTLMASGLRNKTKKSLKTWLTEGLSMPIVALPRTGDWRGFKHGGPSLCY